MGDEASTRTNPTLLAHSVHGPFAHILSAMPSTTYVLLASPANRMCMYREQSRWGWRRRGVRAATHARLTCAVLHGGWCCI